MRRFLLSAVATAIVVAGALAFITLATSEHWRVILIGLGIGLLTSALFSLSRSRNTRLESRRLAIEKEYLRRTVGSDSLRVLADAPSTGLVVGDIEALAERVVAGLLESVSDVHRIDAWALARQSLTATVREGGVAIGGPSRMRQGSVATVAIKISPDPAARDSLRKALSDYEQVSAQAGPVSPVMRVTCDGDGFTIKALSAEDQITIDGATWTFRVRAEQPGRRSLMVTVQMRISSDGTWISCPALSHDVHVTVAPAFVARRFFRDNWQWLAGVALGAAGTISAWQKLF